jgi:E3 ubiquitin-protein ligase RNF13
MFTCSHCLLQKPRIYKMKSCHSLSAMCLVVLCLLTRTSSLIVVTPDGVSHVDNHMTATFGPQPGTYSVRGPLILANPPNLCSPKGNSTYQNSIVLIWRGGCTFLDKVVAAQKSGAIAAVVGDDTTDYPPFIQMAAPAGTDASSITIPAVFISKDEMVDLTFTLSQGTSLNATLNSQGEVQNEASSSPVNSNLQTIGLLLMILPVVWCTIVGVYYIRKVCRDRQESRARAERTVRLPTLKYSPGSTESETSTCTNESCAVCLDDFQPAVEVKVLPCQHGFHPHCIDPWLQSRSELCPICKRSIFEGRVESTTCCFNCC